MRTRVNKWETSSPPGHACNETQSVGDMRGCLGLLGRLGLGEAMAWIPSHEKAMALPTSGARIRRPHHAEGSACVVSLHPPSCLLRWVLSSPPNDRAGNCAERGRGLSSGHTTRVAERDLRARLRGWVGPTDPDVTSDLACGFLCFSGLRGDIQWTLLPELRRDCWEH